MPLNINWQQILIHLFNFFLLFAILYYLLYSPVVKFMEERERKYKEIDDRANKTMKDAQNVLGKYQEKLDNVDEEIKEYKNQKFEEISVQIKEKLDQAKVEENKIITDAKSKAQLEYDRIIENANSDIKEMAMTATKKILGDGDKTSVDAFIEYTLKEGQDGK